MLKKLSGYALALIGLTLLFSSCKKDYQSLASLDEQNIQAYLTKNNINAIKDPSGFYYQITDPGTGAKVQNTDSIYYSYDFQGTTGTSYIKSSPYMVPFNFLGYTDQFTISQARFQFTPIRLVLAMLNRGGTARVIMPSSMAFGKNGNTALNVGSNEIIIVNLKSFAETKQYQIDELELNQFIADNKLTMTKDPSRIRYSISDPGTGTPVTSTSTITVKYAGRLLNGTQFDSNDTGVAFVLPDAVIKGWSLAIPGRLNKGGKMRLLIPSDLGYGVPGNGSIPSNAALDFDIEITDVTN